MANNCFISFSSNIKNIDLPDKFTFPFYYSPHPIALLAAEELQKNIKTIDWPHNFGLDESSKEGALGKMFGVLVVKNKQGEIGYLAGYSGKIGNESTIPPFVPPIYNRLTTDSYYQDAEQVINGLNTQMLALETDQEYLQNLKDFKDLTEEVNQKLLQLKLNFRAAKKIRKSKRTAAKPTLSTTEFSLLEEELKKESIEQQHYIRKITFELNQKLEKFKKPIILFEEKINQLRQYRKEKSNELQQWLFAQYSFIAANGNKKGLGEIFENTIQLIPPSGAGDCAAPKLMQYAFKNEFKPIALAEFWWGISPKSIIRQHLNYYPACKGKCEPILTHMLQGLEIDENPLLKNPAKGKELEILLEDDDVLVVNKPEEFLSVPGKTITDSVQSRVAKMYPDATGPLLVHRIDMSTSGILLIAKNKEAHKFLQKQFLDRTIRKRYTALLDGNIKENEGMIELPLRLDIDNRPCQCVCFEYGKPARTKWKVIERKKNRTLVSFFPITGRTHQLRVHAAHPSGLNAPIVGDDLYGTKENRLHLHAEFIEFVHPTTKKSIKVNVKPNF